MMNTRMAHPAVTCPGESQVNIGETSTVLKDNRGMLMLSESDYDEIMCVCFIMIVLMMMIFDYLIMSV